jgi:hypothetical protein
MKRMGPPKRQLALALAHKAAHPLPVEQREQIVAALADLLLEALGRSPCEVVEDGDRSDEPEDYR